MNMKTILACAGALSLSLGVVACGDADEPANTAPEAPEGIAVTDGWMSLPAVEGNPAAVYFTISNTGDNQATLRSAAVMGAQSATLHDTVEYDFQQDMQELPAVPVMPGDTLEFVPGGRHVMAMNPDATLDPGSETEVTLTFAGGDKISFPVTIYASGDMPDGAATADAEAAE
ncbi:copper chaperone PCu(A)C [Aurantiacibacter spongiae]|uniref:Copper chaperone PCu(A)C n=1 Tax=Aurantiacibacter spongiae TaxID=2488860 RepID=A0A3N5CPJ7_9SPHN|nr:copper chaperone PCu(A)C [Aurantiacibacter spongiae]RPF70286.1 copper chaperone PCu(A)C [Aurantiacibacter spongiae]